MDSEAGQALVHGVAKSRTRLSNTFKIEMAKFSSLVWSVPWGDVSRGFAMIRIR